MYNQPSSLPPNFEPSETISLTDAWAFAIIKPTVQTYKQIAKDFPIPLGKALISLFTAIATGFTLFAIADIWLTGVSNRMAERYFGYFIKSSIDGLVIRIPIAAGIIVVCLMLISSLIHIVAQGLGGRGTYSQLLYCFAVYLAPLTTVSSFLSLIPVVRLANILVLFYAMVLNVIATKAVHQLSWAKAILASTIIWGLVILAIVVAPLLQDTCIGNSC